MAMDDLARSCRSYRKFAQEPVPEDLVRAMVENARVTASAANAQPLRYAVVRSPELVEAMQPLVSWAAKLPREVATPKPGEQPTCFIAVSQILDGPVASWADVDLGIAVQTMALTAAEAGLGCCMMGAIRVKSISELLGIPEDQKLRLVLALGYPAHASTVVDAPQDGDLSYYVDEKLDYFVPKRPLEQVCRFV